jgi:hypothetical protein
MWHRDAAEDAVVPEEIAVDIEEFYDEDPRRRTSNEVEFGQDWSDANGVRYELSWVEDTGEVYAMREPAAAIEVDPVGDEWVDKLSSDAVTVEILGTVAERAELDRRLEGWQDAIVRPGSLSWLRSRFAEGTTT